MEKEVKPKVESSVGKEAKTEAEKEDAVEKKLKSDADKEDDVEKRVKTKTEKEGTVEKEAKDASKEEEKTDEREDSVSFRKRSTGDTKLHLKLPSAEAKGIILEEKSELSGRDPASTDKKSPAVHAQQTENVFYATSSPKAATSKPQPPAELLDERSQKKVNAGASNRKTL